MKKYMYLVLGLMVSACTTSKTPKMVISVLEDTTETDFIAQPQPNALIDQFGLDSNLWQSVAFRYGRINSLTHNSRRQVHLDAQNQLLENELERKQLVTEFKSDVKELLMTPKESTVYRHSSIWLPLVEELEVLQQDKNSQVTLYLYSDLRENNSQWFSTYRPKDMQLLERDREAVIQLFLDKAVGVKATNHIKVVVVYQPRTIKEDELFRRLKDLYLQLFLRLGIPVEFKANI